MVPASTHRIFRIALTDEALAVHEDLVDAIDCLTSLVDRGAGDAFPCMIAPNIGVDDTGMPKACLPSYRLENRTLRVCGMMPDLDRPVSWKDGRAEFVSGTPVLAELFAMLASAVDAPVGAILGSISPPSPMLCGGPIVQTAVGPRWLMTGVHAFSTSMDCIVVDRIPPSALVPAEGLDPRCHVGVDLDELRLVEREERMLRIHCTARTITAPRTAA